MGTKRANRIKNGCEMKRISLFLCLFALSLSAQGLDTDSELFRDFAKHIEAANETSGIKETPGWSVAFEFYVELRTQARVSEEDIVSLENYLNAMQLEAVRPSEAMLQSLLQLADAIDAIYYALDPDEPLPEFAILTAAAAAGPVVLLRGETPELSPRQSPVASPQGSPRRGIRRFWSPQPGVNSPRAKLTAGSPLRAGDVITPRADGRAALSANAHSATGMF